MLVKIPDQAHFLGRPRLLLAGFPGVGFPARDGLDQCIEILKRLEIPVLYVPQVSKKLQRVLDFKADVAIFYRTKMKAIEGDRECLGALHGSCRRALWCCDLKSAEDLAKPSQGLFDDIFLPWWGDFNNPTYRTGDCSTNAWKKSSGSRVWYMPQGSVLREPLDYTEGQQTVFLGDIKTRFHDGRAELCKKLSVEVMNSPVRTKRLEIEAKSQQLYSSAMYSLTTSPPAPGYTSIRTYNILCWGALALLQSYPDCEKQFQHGEHLLAFNSILEGKRVTSRYRKRPEARARIRQAAWVLAAKKHTITHRILNIVANALDIDDTYWGYL